MFDGPLKIALAEAEARRRCQPRPRDTTKRWRRSDRIGFRAFEAELRRARGEILLKRDPGNSARAEGAFRTAIDITRRQGTRSFELRAALSLADSTNRPAASRRTTRSRPRSKALRRRWKCRRSPRRRLCSGRLLRLKR